jgi:hypothetical protein
MTFSPALTAASRTQATWVVRVPSETNSPSDLRWPIATAGLALETSRRASLIQTVRDAVDADRRGSGLTGSRAR